MIPWVGLITDASLQRITKFGYRHFHPVVAYRQLRLATHKHNALHLSSRGFWVFYRLSRRFHVSREAVMAEYIVLLAHGLCARDLILNEWFCPSLKLSFVVYFFHCKLANTNGIPPSSVLAMA